MHRAEGRLLATVGRVSYPAPEDRVLEGPFPEARFPGPADRQYRGTGCKGVERAGGSEVALVAKGFQLVLAVTGCGG
jgi:hypothetical protein